MGGQLCFQKNKVKEEIQRAEQHQKDARTGDDLPVIKEAGLRDERNVSFMTLPISFMANYTLTAYKFL